jgi:hypothetical protein
VDYHRLRLYRSVALFVAGLLGTGYEVVVNHVERPSVLVLLAGMMGLPAFFERDADRREGKSGGAP